MIKISQVCKSFKDNEVLKNVTISFESGKIYGIIGRNASGKSVLFKTICGFLEPDSGSVVVNNIDIYKNKCFASDTSILIEEPKFIDELTGLENLILLAKIKNNTNKDKIVELLDKVGISKEDQKKIYKSYSVGTKQKLGIAQVLMEDDKILILDEPFNGLDDCTVKRIRTLLQLEKKRGKLILLASHIKEDIDILCDEVYKIDNGLVKKV